MGSYAVEVCDLVKEFDGRRVLDHVTFNVREGEVFGYLGPNGAGKTTTLRILLGLIKPTSGKVVVLGEDPVNNDELRVRVGVLLESDGLYDTLTAFENLDFYARLYGLSNSSERRERIVKLLKFMGLYERKDDKVGCFSRGMRRKLGIMRAIVHSPEVVFMDEPMSGLDPETRAIIRSLIVKLAKEESVTMFIISHDLHDVEEICSSAAILINGRVIANDPIENLKRRFGKPVMEITFVDELSAVKGLRILRKKGLECVKDRCCLCMIPEDNDVLGMLRYLAEEGLKIVSVKEREASLEDIYMSIVKEVDVK